jgi:hypothetical protein
MLEGRGPLSGPRSLLRLMDDLPPVLESPPAPPPPPAMSLAARLLNIFAIPGEVFEVVKASRISVGNWLLPMVLSGAVLGLTAAVVISQPSIQRQMQDRFDQQVKTLQQEVKAGKMKQADLDRTVAVTRAITAPPVLRALVGAGGTVAGVARVFWWAFVLWLLARLFLKVRLNYFKALEVSGLALMIGVLGGVVMLLLMVNLPKLFAAPGLASAVIDFDPVSKTPLLLVTANVFSFWLIGVLAVGLARLTRVPFLRAAWFVFAFWLMQESVLIMLGGALGQFAL